MSADMTEGNGTGDGEKPWTSLCGKLNNGQKRLTDLRREIRFRMVNTTVPKMVKKVFYDSGRLTTNVGILNKLIGQIPKDELQNPGEFSDEKETNYDFCAKKQEFPVGEEGESIKDLNPTAKDKFIDAIRIGKELGTNPAYRFAFDLVLPEVKDLDSALEGVSKYMKKLTTDIRSILMYRIASEFLPKSTINITKAPLKIKEDTAGAIGEALRAISALKKTYITPGPKTTPKKLGTSGPSETGSNPTTSRAASVGEIRTPKPNKKPIEPIRAGSNPRKRGSSETLSDPLKKPKSAEDVAEIAPRTPDQTSRSLVLRLPQSMERV